MKKFLTAIHVLNAGMAVDSAGLMPLIDVVPEKARPWALLGSVLLGALLPSFRGMGHKVMFKDQQDRSQ